MAGFFAAQRYNGNNIFLGSLFLRIGVFYGVPHPFFGNRVKYHFCRKLIALRKRSEIPLF